MIDFNIIRDFVRFQCFLFTVKIMFVLFASRESLFTASQSVVLVNSVFNDSISSWLYGYL